MTPDEKITHAGKNMDKCEFTIRKELTFSGFAIIAFAVSYPKVSSIPYLIDAVVYSLLLSGAFSIILIHIWKYNQALFISRADINKTTQKEKNTWRVLQLFNCLYKFFYVVGVLSAVTLYATSKSVIPAP